MNIRIFTAICVLLAIVTVAQCRRWYASDVGCWITQKKVPTTWEDAQRRCQTHDAVLASPLNTRLLDYMQSLITVHNHSAPYFIGIRAERSSIDKEVYFVSVEGKRLEDMPRAVYDAIEKLDLEQGDCLSMDRNGISAMPCHDNLPYVCYSNETRECGLEPTTTSTTAAPTSTTPRPGYSLNPVTGSYYKFHNVGVSWDEADATCASEGAQLLVVNDAIEANLLPSIENYNYGTWVGLRDRRMKGESHWRTVYDAVLASPLNTRLLDYMQSLITVHNHSAPYFIGIRAERSSIDKEVYFVSVEGKRLEDMPRAVYDAIEKLDLEQGDCLSMDRNGIGAVPCHDNLPYVCYSNETRECGLEPTTTSTTAAPTSTTPRPGYALNPVTGSYYKFHNVGVSWNEADATCASEGAQLLVLDDAIEANLLPSIENYNYGTWVGLRDRRMKGESHWLTVYGQPVSEVYNKWVSNRPYNTGVYNCGFFFEKDKLLYDEGCATQYYFTCEIQP